MTELYILLGFMIFAAIVAIELHDLLSSVIAVSAVGLSLSMAFLDLKAPDVAITQLVVEILCLIILIRATIHRDIPFSTSGRWLLNTTIALAFVTTFLTVTWKAIESLPPFGYPILHVSSTYMQEGLVRTGATNLVAAVSLNYRTYDRLGEATAMITALVGVLTLLRKYGHNTTAGENEDKEC
jgi:multisubunit Na+/H+ antiporter MnhB subunit